MPDEEKNFGVSLVLDFRIWWRQVQAKNSVYLCNMAREHEQKRIPHSRAT